MPWKDVRVSEQRIRFVIRANSGEESMAGLCREFGISRPTGYLWLKRGREGDGVQGLRELSRRPKTSPRRTASELEAAVVAQRQARPDWGARKLQKLLEREGISLKTETIHRILQRHDLIAEHQQHPAAIRRFERALPNQLWQMDFKGLPPEHGRTCTPLSVLDDCSRLALGLTALRSNQGRLVREQLTSTFQQSGLPDAMLMDHGKPWWDAHQPCGWTRLSIWLMQLGIRLHFAAIRHPQTQGKVERFHRSIQAALRGRGYPPDQQSWPAWLEQFRLEYNNVRPHEALDMATPASRWRPSPRPFPEKLRDWEYDSGAELKRVRPSGVIAIAGRDYFVSAALAGQQVQLQAFSAGRILVFYCRTCVREIDELKRQTYPVYFSREQPVFDED